MNHFFQKLCLRVLAAGSLLLGALALVAAPSGATPTFTTLYSFSAKSTMPPYSNGDGAHPGSSLVQGSDGNFYGTTREGGSLGVGTVFRVTPTGALTTLHSFSGYPNEGANPQEGLVEGSDGNFYGTTDAGGPSNSGTAFKLTSVGDADDAGGLQWHQWDYTERHTHSR